MQISNHGRKSNARQAHPRHTSILEERGNFQSRFFSFEKMENGIWTDICNIFTISPDSEPQGAVLSSSSILLSISCPKITHLHNMTGNFQTESELKKHRGKMGLHNGYDIKNISSE